MIRSPVLTEAFSNQGASLHAIVSQTTLLSPYHPLSLCALFAACIVASSGNCYIVRRQEIPVGWQLTDGEGNIVADGARSSIAATRGVRDVTLSRAALQVREGAHV